MTNREASKLATGIYRLDWKGGGSSVAAVGVLYDGTRWFAPVNWTSEVADHIASTNWRIVEAVRAYEF